MRIGLIGAGVMGEVIVAALVNKRLFAPTDIIVSDVSQGALDTMVERHQVRTTPDNERVIAESDLFLVCVKPQQAAEVLAPLKGRVGPEQLAVSIMAGVGMDSLRTVLGHSRVIRAMPNLPAQLGEGMTAWMATPEVPDVWRQVARAVFQAFGREVEVDREDLVDAATAVSGSGPAYVFHVAELMIRSAMDMGFDATQAERMVLQTFQGAVDLWAHSKKSPEQLRLNVTSKGGTTQAALESFARNDLPRVIHDGLHAAYARAGELRRLMETRSNG